MTTRRAGRLVTAAVVAVGLAVGAGIVATQTGSATGLLDLRIYLGAARALADGGSLYDHRSPVFHLGATYPPLWTVLVRPVSGLDVTVVEAAWTVTNLALWGRILWVLAGGRRRPAAVTPAALAAVWLVTLASAPVWNTLNQGQVNLVLWALVATDLERVARTGRGGWRTGLAAAIKLTPAMVAVLLAAAGRRRTAVVAAATAAVLTLAAWLAVPADSARYWTGLVLDTDRVGPIADAQSSSLTAVAARAAGGDPALGGAVGRLLLAGAAVVVVAVAARRFRRALDAGAALTAATVAGCATALVSPIAWTHHLVFLCFPLLLLTGRRGPAWRAARVAVVVALVDPVGWGRLAFTSTARTVAMVVVLALADRLATVEVDWRAGDPGGGRSTTGDGAVATG